MAAALFRKLSVSAGADGLVAIDDLPRWIKRKDDEDAKLLTYGECEVLRLSSEALVVLVEHEQNRFLCSFGFPAPDELPAGCIETSPTPGLFGIAADQSGVRPTATSSQIRDVIQGQGRGINEYAGHDLEQVLPLFPVFHAYHLNGDQIFSRSLTRLAGAFCARTHVGRPLPIDRNTISSFIQLFEAGDDAIPFHIPLQALLAFGWSTVFLELYRCIEQLYSVPHLMALTEKWPSGKSLRDVAELIENSLGWRPKEEDSLRQLLSSASDASVRQARSALSRTDTDVDITTAACAAKIYRLRNACVHYRPALGMPKLADEDWNELVQAMIAIMLDLYEKYGQRFQLAVSVGGDGPLVEAAA